MVLIAKRNLCLIHFVLTVLGLGLVGKLVAFLNRADLGIGVASTDIKMQVHRTERDFFLMAISFSCWVYVWRLSRIMKTYKKLKGSINE
jgi:hypothetical protein